METDGKLPRSFFWQVAGPLVLGNDWVLYASPLL